MSFQDLTPKLDPCAKREERLTKLIALQSEIIWVGFPNTKEKKEKIRAIQAKREEESLLRREYDLVCGEQAIYIDGIITWRLAKWGEEWMVSDCNNVKSGEFKRTWK